MMGQRVIGVKEKQHRDMREARYSEATKPVSKRELLATVAAILPATSGKKPVKRKGNKR